MTSEEIESSFAFIMELEKLKSITRKVKPVGQDRYENTAEHSWQAAILGLTLAKLSREDLDAEKIVKMLLIHDICEIDSDDVFFFDETARNDIKESEMRSAKRIFGMLPGEIGDQYLAIWLEFEAAETKEAKFAKANDRLMPVLQNLHNNRQSWDENGIGKEQILAKTAFIADAGELVWQSVSEKIEAIFDK